MTATQIGSSAIRSAVIPDGIVCSPNEVTPRPPTFKAIPTIAWSRICLRVSERRASRAKKKTRASIAAPARAKRIATIAKGGIASPAPGSTTTRIARYVVPQTT